MRRRSSRLRELRGEVARPTLRAADAARGAVAAKTARRCRGPRAVTRPSPRPRRGPAAARGPSRDRAHPAAHAAAHADPAATARAAAARAVPAWAPPLAVAAWGHVAAAAAAGLRLELLQPPLLAGGCPRRLGLRPRLDLLVDRRERLGDLILGGCLQPPPNCMQGG